MSMVAGLTLRRCLKYLAFYLYCPHPFKRTLTGHLNPQATSVQTQEQYCQLIWGFDMLAETEHDANKFTVLENEILKQGQLVLRV